MSTASKLVKQVDPRPGLRGRRVLALAIGVVLSALVLVGGDAARAADRGGTNSPAWVATWATAPHALGPFAGGTPASSGLEDMTVRNIVHVSVGGRAIRLRLTNRLGERPVTFDAVGVGIQQQGAALVPGSSRVVTFRGRRRVTIPDRAEVLSDPVAMRVAAHQNLAVSLYSAGPTGPPTTHWFANQRNYLSALGDFTADESAGPFTRAANTWYFVRAVDARVSRRVTGAIVALGDSITDGSASTPDANRRWPDVLARRLLAGPSRQLRSVVNAGILGNNVHESSLCFGENALARLGDDVVARAGVREMILLEGINDITHPVTPEPRFPCLTRIPISTAGLIEHYEQIIDRAHARGLRIYGGTLTPSMGWPGFTATTEVQRQEINRWIRTGGAFDAVIDFDAVLRDPADPAQLAPQYDSGDHLHPNDAGHERMGDTAYRVLRRFGPRWRGRAQVLEGRR